MNSTNFPEFSGYDQSFDFTPYLPADQPDQPTTPQPKSSEMERFWGIAGNWGEFGLYFGLGLSASLIVRAIPVLQPSALILVPAVSAGLVALQCPAPDDTRVRCQVILVAVTAAIVGGNWDAWMAWFVTNAWKIGATLLLIGVGIYFVPPAGGKKNV